LNNGKEKWLKNLSPSKIPFTLKKDAKFAPAVKKVSLQKI